MEIIRQVRRFANSPAIPITRDYTSTGASLSGNIGDAGAVNRRRGGCETFNYSSVNSRFGCTWVTSRITIPFSSTAITPFYGYSRSIGQVLFRADTDILKVRIYC